jgi:hypothetical protein
MTKRLLMLLAVIALAYCVAGPVLAEDQKGAADTKANASGDQAKTPDDQNKDKEVVIRGVSRLRVKIEKPEPDLTFDVDEIAVPYVKTEDDVLDVSPTAMAYPAVSVPTTLESTQAASPYVLLFQRPPILKLAPKFNSQVGIANWRLRITDGFGNVFMDFSGSDNLPKQIVWDGRGKAGDMLDVGTSYSYIFSIIDVASNPTSQMGKPIVLESLLYDEQGATVAKVVASVFFKTTGRKTEISPKGKLYLREIADLLTSRQNYPLVIESYAKDVDDAQYKGEMIQDFLSERLTLPKDRFKISPQKSTVPKIVFRVR